MTHNAGSLPAPVCSVYRAVVVLLGPTGPIVALWWTL